MGLLLFGRGPQIQTSATSISGFGDSITVGIGASDQTHAWLNVLGVSLGNATLNNAGVSSTILQGTGNQANNGVGRYAAALTGGNKTEMVFSLYGYNDARFTGSPATTVVAFTTDYQTIITGLLAAGYARSKIVLGSPPFMNATGYTLGGSFAGSNDTVMQAYRDATFTLARNNGLFFADIYNVFKSNTSLIGPDNIHPNDAGMAAIAAAFQTAAIV